MYLANRLRVPTRTVFAVIRPQILFSRGSSPVKLWEIKIALILFLLVFTLEGFQLLFFNSTQKFGHYSVAPTESNESSKTHTLKLTVIGSKTSVTGARQDLSSSLDKSLKLVNVVFEILEIHMLTCRKGGKQKCHE